MTLGEKLKMYRKQKGVSQEKIAELVGVSRQAVTKWESGQTAPSTENLMALASIYGISLDELAADKKAGGADDRKILHTNLTLIAIILQASFLNAAIQPSQVRETDPPFMKTVELAIKFVPLFAASVWMAGNLRYEKDAARYKKNARIELLYCLIQLAAAFFGYYSRLYFVGTVLLIVNVLVYIFVINPRYMKRRLTREWKKKRDPLGR